MSRVLKTSERKLFRAGGIRVDKIIHKRRRERDLKIKRFKGLYK